MQNIIEAIGYLALTILILFTPVINTYKGLPKTDLMINIEIIVSFVTATSILIAVYICKKHEK